MRRRQFITLTAAATLTATLGLQESVAQVPRKRPLVGWLYFAQYDLIENWLRLFLEGMREFGGIEGRDFDMVYRSAEGKLDQLPQAAADLVQLNPEVIVAPATIQAVAAKKATNTIPIVVPVLADPVTLGFVQNDAHPGGNVTGIAPYVKGLPAKQLELAHEIVPSAIRIGLLNDVYDPKGFLQRGEIEAAAQGFKIKIVPADVRTTADIASAYEALTEANVEAVVIEQSNMLIAGRKEIAKAAAERKLPTVYGYRELRLEDWSVTGSILTGASIARRIT